MRRRDGHHVGHRTLFSAPMPAVLVLAVGTSCSSAPNAKAKATLVASKSRINPGDSVTLSGAFSTRKPGLDVRLESSDGTGATFTATGDAAATDGSGSYTLNYRPDQPGQVSVRIEVTDGTKKTASTPIQLTVLAATTVTARLIGAAEIVLGKRTTMTGHVTPAVLGRAVGMESSVDGAQWTATHSTTATDGAGKFTISVPIEPAGPVQLVSPVSRRCHGRSATERRR